MGLFSRKKNFDDLDLPPPPPPISELPPVPPVGEELTNELPDLPQIGAEENEDYPSEMDIELPPLPNLESVNARENEKDIKNVEGLKPEEDIDVSEEVEMPRTVDLKQKRVVEGPLFVNVISYKDAISNINIIKEKIRESEAYLEKLNEIKNLRDKYFEQLRAKLEDLQRKSLYVDKSLFG